MKCYYEVLGVECDASSDEIKKSFRKQALVWHPDKNSDRVEEATVRFKEIQAAYAVLSDPHERKWYDDHKESILRGGDGMGASEEDRPNLWPYFRSSCFDGFAANDKNSFYTVYHDLFKKLDIQEQEVKKHKKMDDASAPEFGDADTPWEKVERFYQYWRGFKTAKTFAFMDQYNPNEAPNRRIRRLIDKENKKARDAGKREYNDEIHELVRRVRKLDKRVLHHLAEIKKENEEKEKELALEKEKQSKEAQRKEEELRKAEADGWNELEEMWQGNEALREMLREMDLVDGYDDVDEEERDDDNDDNDDSDEDGNDCMSELEDLKQFKAKQEERINKADVLYCGVCKKKFKSKSQWENHERSKKHIELSAKMREELRVGGDNFSDDNKEDLNNIHDELDGDDIDEDMCSEVVDEVLLSKETREEESGGAEQKEGNEGMENSSDHEEEETAEEFAERLKRELMDSDDEDWSQTGRRGKKRGKKGRKSASNSLASVASPNQKADPQKARTTEAKGHRCNVCQQEFLSKSKLFKHVRQEGHAQAVAVTTSNSEEDGAAVGGKGKKKGRRRAKR